MGFAFAILLLVIQSISKTVVVFRVAWLKVHCLAVIALCFGKLSLAVKGISDTDLTAGIVRAKASGISIDTRQFDLYDFREGRVVRAILGFRSRSDALEAAGLSE